MKIFTNFFVVYAQLIYTCCVIYAQETVTDYDGNVYNTVIIGDQIWLKENLKSLHYNDGNEIPGAVAYNNDDSLGAIYGLLYTWDAAMNGSNVPGTQGVCPCEWHLPTSAEWSELENFLGGSSVAGGKMKDTTAGFWQSPNTGADNSSGFTGLPAGEYDTNQGIFQLLNQYAVFWTSTSVSTTKANERYLSYNNASSTSFDWYKTLKYSIRCIKDEVSDMKETGDNSIPDEFQLFQNYPNPFNPTTTISYQIHELSYVTLKVYGALGNELLTLVNEEKSSGNYAINFDGSNLTSGIYFYRLSSGSLTDVKKMLLIK